MIFSSILFLLYFLPVFILVYSILPKQVKNWFILLASIVFYAWGAPEFVFILIASTIANFYIIKRLHSSIDKKQVLLTISVVFNLALLGYFKYANFFIDNVNAALTLSGFSAISWTKVALPIGISFYTFQTISYSIDVFRGQCEPLKKLRDYMVYIMCFPQMIAGPIVRYNEIAGQITNRQENIDNKLQGFVRFCIGLGKKVLIADVLAHQVNSIIDADIENITTYSAWVGVLSYSFQMYFDFSGYSDMAIGLGRIMGFKFPENFNNPFTSRSLTEYWRRWHMSLSRWLTDYLFTPLALKYRDYRKTGLALAIFITFVLSGLWHGASWNYVLWGAIHGIILMSEALFLLKAFKKIPLIPAILLNYFILQITWVFFRIEDINKAFAYLKTMFTPVVTDGMPLSLDAEFKTTFIVATIFSFITLTKPGKYLEQLVFYKNNPSLKWYLVAIPLSLIVFILSVSYITNEGFSTFIYFRF